MAAPKGNCFNPKGRPRMEIDWKLFEECCHLLCTQDEITALMKISDEQLRVRVKEQYGEDYLDAYKRLSAGGKKSLRRHQFAMSETNATMAIWLGKQLLGQRDTPQENVISPEVLKAHDLLMYQIASMQVAQKEKGDESPSSSQA
jgi:hypothetical protein